MASQLQEAIAGELTRRRYDRLPLPWVPRVGGELRDQLGHRQLRRMKQHQVQQHRRLEHVGRVAAAPPSVWPVCPFFI